jgi:nitroimidazol reductase NimA-like FMN-containing flavoprotein (pyridoxamine 5'-phosphate oxidase superfamily)
MRRLSDDAIATVLAENGVGVLALRDPEAGYPYPLPVAYGYDPESDALGIQLEGGEESDKLRCLERDRSVGFTVFEESESGSVWRSALVRGEVVETDYEAAEPAFAALAKNTQSAPNPLFWGKSGTVTPFRLRIDEWSGRAFDV